MLTLDFKEILHWTILANIIKNYKISKTNIIITLIKLKSYIWLLNNTHEIIVYVINFNKLFILLNLINIIYYLVLLDIYCLLSDFITLTNNYYSKFVQYLILVVEFSI